MPVLLWDIRSYRRTSAARTKTNKAVDLTVRSRDLNQVTTRPAIEKWIVGGGDRVAGSKTGCAPTETDRVRGIGAFENQRALIVIRARRAKVNRIWGFLHS